MLKLETKGMVRGQRTLVAPVDVCFANGALTMVLGANGAGKSSLLSLLAGTASPSDLKHTRVVFSLENGTHDLTASDLVLSELPLAKRAQQLAVLTQQNPLDFAFRVADVVTMGAYPLGLSASELQQKLAQVLEVCDLVSLAEQAYTQLSGGERQRVHVARVLMQVGKTTKALLLDEPLTALDLKHQHQILAHLRKLADEGLCVVTVLHDPELAARYGHELLLLKQGEVLAHGPCQALWQSHLLSALYDMEIRADSVNELPRLTVL